MELESYFDFVDADTIRLRGHRIDLAHVLAYYHEGYSPEAIALELPTLSLEAIYAAFTYYLHNRAAVDAYLTRRAAQAAQLMHEAAARDPSPVAQRVQALRARLGQDHAA